MAAKLLLPLRLSPSSFTKLNSHLKSNSRQNLTSFPSQSPHLTKTFNPVFINRPVSVRFTLNSPLISPRDPWAIWTALFATAAFGIWSERSKIGSALSGALVRALVGFAASNLGVIPCDSPAYSVVLEFLLPLAVPLLLFRADLGRVLQSTGKLLLAFLIGSAATTVGTVIAYLLVPMRALGQDTWKIAAALMGRHIGGAVNYVAISDALGVSSSVLAAGLAADNVICAVYFTTLFALASKVPPEPPTSSTDQEIVAGQQASCFSDGYCSCCVFSNLQGWCISNKIFRNSRRQSASNYKHCRYLSYHISSPV